MNVNLKTALACHELELKRLFLNCFDDTLGFVNMFFANHFVPENTVIAEKDGRVIGMAFLLPCTAEEKPCFYIYGVCVAPDERKSGIGSALLKFAAEYAKSLGARVLLRPENESLFSFYEKAGFSPCSYYKTETFASRENAATLSPVSAEEYLTLRNRGFADRNPVLWDKAAIEHALNHETFFGFSAYKFEVGDEAGILLCGKDGGEPFIKETTASAAALPAVAAAALAFMGGEEITVLLPSDQSGIPYAYGIGFKNPVYLNLMLD